MHQFKGKEERIRGMRIKVMEETISRYKRRASKPFRTAAVDTVSDIVYYDFKGVRMVARYVACGEFWFAMFSLIESVVGVTLSPLMFVVRCYDNLTFAPRKVREYSRELEELRGKT